MLPQAYTIVAKLEESYAEAYAHYEKAWQREVYRVTRTMQQLHQRSSSTYRWHSSAREMSRSASAATVSREIGERCPVIRLWCNTSSGERQRNIGNTIAGNCKRQWWPGRFLRDSSGNGNDAESDDEESPF